MILILHALLQRAYVSKASEAGIEYFPAFFGVLGMSIDYRVKVPNSPAGGKS